MSVTSTIADLKVALIKAIEDAVSPGGHEPDIVARLTVNIPRNLASISQIGNYKLSVGGIFVHQKPKVWVENMPPGKSIELGDLLIISTINTLEGKTSKKAMLYQAKMFKDFPIEEPKNEYQHTLYRDWPMYKYVHAELKNKWRCLNYSDIHRAAKYLLLRKGPHPNLISRNWKYPTFKYSNALTAHPSSPLSNYRLFDEELFRIVLSVAGRRFRLLSDSEYEKYSQEHDYYCEHGKRHTDSKFYPYARRLMGWNLMVNDLLRTIPKAKTPPMGRASGQGNTPSPRGVNITGFSELMKSESTLKTFLSKQYSSDLPPTNNQIEPSDDDSEGGGMSVIEFILTESENPQEMRPDEQAE